MASYKESGVDLDKNARLKEEIKKAVRKTFTPQVVGDVGLFGGLYDLSALKTMDAPVLVASTDGVGTKLMIAKMLGNYETVGIDLVHHCINDILVQGAKPLIFLDYIAGARLEPSVTGQIIKGLAKACKESGIPLIGGETAEMPGTYSPGEYDLAGTIIGIVDKAAILDGSRIEEGDAIIGLPSSGLHTNGYSLARKALLEKRKVTDSVPGVGNLGEALLAPHRNYLPIVAPLLAQLHGMAHITGGGFTENIPRVLPKGLGAAIKKGSWNVPALFTLIQTDGSISEQEMMRTFNMGIGMVLFCENKDAARIAKATGGALIGSVEKGAGVRTC